MITPYLNIVTAQSYFDGRLHTEPWDGATDDDKLKALKMATALIDNLDFIGRPAELTQLNQFPRLGQLFVPPAIFDAVCEIALELLDDADVNLDLENVARVSEGFATLRTQYQRDFILPHIKNGIPSSMAWAKLQPYLADHSSIKLVRVS